MPQPGAEPLARHIAGTCARRVRCLEARQGDRRSEATRSCPTAAPSGDREKPCSSCKPNETGSKAMQKNAGMIRGEAHISRARCCSFGVTRPGSPS